eukprot:2220683-Alexandrium_andersonii.AAC.1
MTADMKARREVHEFTQHYNATFMCDACWATRLTGPKAPRHLLFSDFAEQAGWTHTRMNFDAYMRYQPPSPWLQVRGIHPDN